MRIEGKYHGEIPKEINAFLFSSGKTLLQANQTIRLTSTCGPLRK